MLRLQKAKAMELFESWGVEQKELERLIEAGAVQTHAAARGKGSVRLFDEESILDVFVSHIFHDIGLPPRRIAFVVQHLRPHYEEWLERGLRQVCVQFEAHRVHASTREMLPVFCLDIDPAIRLVDLCKRLERKSRLSRLERGRPSYDWRGEFRQAALEIAREMQEKAISEEEIDAAIDEIRAQGRSQDAETSAALVSVPPPS